MRFVIKFFGDDNLRHRAVRNQACCNCIRLRALLDGGALSLSLLTVAFFFVFSRTDSADSTDCLLILLSIFVFTL